MEVIKQDGEFSLTVLFQDQEKTIRFSFESNYDLYWTFYLRKDVNRDYTFKITKENYSVYQLFEQLFSDIENINLFDNYDMPLYIKTDDDKIEYLNQKKENIEYQKTLFREYNQSYYNSLFDKNNEIITWYSDETTSKVANILKIKKEKDSFKLEFKIQPYIDGYDEDFHSLYCIPIRFRNSGSRYDPFNVVFMKMYNNMKKIDDINDYGHQMHIEEYLYNKEKVKKLIK